MYGHRPLHQTATNKSQQDRIVLENLAVLSTTSSEPEPRYLHLLIPGNQKEANLAKSIISAVINGFPVPTILNWGFVYDDPLLAAGGSHLGKITGALSWMEVQGRERDNDLVLVVDGYDTWFQLHASVLISRYFEINKRAHQRIKNDIGSTAMREEDIGQHIVMATQKVCWPRDEDDPACYALPESPVPKDVYGPDTDKTLPSNPIPNSNFRQQYLNSGLIMGDIKHMRALFQRAKEKIDLDTNSGSDQDAFSAILGEQEYQRALAHETHLSYWEKLGRKFGHQKPSILDSHATRNPMVAQAGKNYEFGLGLDYYSELSQTLAFSQNDMAWIHFDDEEAIKQAKQANKVTADRKIIFPKDIDENDPPFPYTAFMNRFPQNAQWSEVPLYTNLYTSTVPGIIHINGGDNKHLSVDAWEQIWFQPYVRQLLDAFVMDSDGPMAITFEGSRQVDWWGVAKDREVVRTFGRDGAGSVSWVTLLQGFESEIFRDGHGPWQVPNL